MRNSFLILRKAEEENETKKAVAAATAGTQMKSTTERVISWVKCTDKAKYQEVKN